MMSTARTRVVPGSGEVALETLLSRMAGGDQNAFRELYARTSGRLFAICLRIAKDRALAEEFLQEAYVRVFERARQFDAARGSALAWMIALTRNHAIDVIRLRAREMPLPDDFVLEVAATATSRDAETAIDSAVAWRALEEGPRRAIVAAYRDGLSYKELAVLLGVPVGTVKTWVHRGIAKLRTALDCDTCGA